MSFMVHVGFGRLDLCALTKFAPPWHILVRMCSPHIKFFRLIAGKIPAGTVQHTATEAQPETQGCTLQTPTSVTPVSVNFKAHVQRIHALKRTQRQP